MRERAWTPGFSSALRTYSSSPSGCPSQVRWYRSRTRPPLRAKCGSRGKIHDRCCQGLMASSASHRRTVDAETDGTMPAAAASRASSGQVQRASGFPLAAGSSQARALTSATTRAANLRGRPGRGASASPSMPLSQYRRRHLRAVSSQTPARTAIALFGRPSAAISTIRARARAVAPARERQHPLARPVRLCQRPAPRRHDTAAIAAALRRVCQHLGLRHLPGQPRRLRELHPAQRIPGRYPAGSPRLRLRPLPQRHYGLARPATPDELTGAPTRCAENTDRRWLSHVSA